MKQSKSNNMGTWGLGILVIVFLYALGSVFTVLKIGLLLTFNLLIVVSTVILPFVVGKLTKAICRLSAPIIQKSKMKLQKKMTKEDK
ncbi:hypothetical protein [Enterococcus sp. BWR-S5]|uniref:hypothetical protein n=1 Tax=Enterococcus sp. BWR-S5 TaxID=2787714 RepID=UPI001924352D|nr:hypothetical protein [Enterococcus sp. BWR-S5]MBL1223909.1 hypothetical protein [Enterococcus sp. BWR-S5]